MKEVNTTCFFCFLDKELAMHDDGEGDQLDAETRSAPAKRRRHRVLSDDEDEE